MKYTGKFFKESMPEWKRKKDPILVRLFYRRVSFYLSAFLANRGVTANSVSFFSVIIGAASCILFLFPYKLCHIGGALLINVWLTLDCVDGNLARSVKKQPFGDFADAISSYILVGLLNSALGVAVFCTGGILVKAGNLWMIYLGALASASDTLMRLVYQKYKNTERDLQDKGIIEPEKDVREDHNQVGNIRVRLELELGIAGILPVAILVSSIIGTLDIIIIYSLCYYGGAFLLTLLKYIRNAKRYSNIPMP